MSLVNCFECEKEFSNSRTDCPHCGAYMEGHAPRQESVVDLELQEIANERKFKKKILESLSTTSFSKALKTFKNGFLKSRRSLGFYYLHGEVLSFNSYMDTDVDVIKKTVSEVTSIGQTSYTTKSQDVVSEVSVTKTKVTEISIKHESEEIKKYYFRGPEIDFLRPGDPVTLGILAVDFNNHSDDISQFDSFGIVHNGEICPILLINRSMDAHHTSHVITGSEYFEENIFDDSMSYWRYVIGAGFILDLFAGSFPLLGIISIVGLGIVKFLLMRGQSERREEYRQWWLEQVDDVQNIIE